MIETTEQKTRATESTLDYPLFPLFLDLRDRTVVVIGAGPIGSEKATRLLDSGARVRLIAKSLDHLPKSIRSHPRLELHERGFHPRDLTGALLVVAATEDEGTQDAVLTAGRDRGVLVNVVDRPTHCDFTYGAVVRRGDLQAVVSTSGKFPILAQRVRDLLSDLLPSTTGEALNELESARQWLRTRSSDYTINRRKLGQLLSPEAMDEIKSGDLPGLRRRIERWSSSLTSLSHRESPFDALEGLLTPSHLSRARSWAAGSGELAESVVVHTCHRLELYGVAADPQGTARKWTESLSEITERNPQELGGRLLQGRDATRHLFEVTAGLDSVLLGEDSIVGQVRNAYREAGDHELCGPWLHRLFHTALRCSRRVRESGELRPKFRSLSALAVEAGLVGRNPSSVRLLILGTGRAGKAALDTALKRGVRNITVFGSDRERARLLAESREVDSAAIAQLPERTNEADVLVTASGQGRLLTDAELTRARSRRASALTIVDLGVPANTEPTARGTLRRS